MEIILILIFFPFVLMYYIFKWILEHIFHKQPRSSQGESAIDEYDYYEKDFNAKCELDNKYSKIVKQHYEYIEKIGMLYTIANNLSLPDSPQMQKVIDLCLKDIALAPQLADYYIQWAKLYNEDVKTALPTYPSFKRLAIIYEKQKEYEKAIEVCNQAIKLGFYKDDTTGQMPGRLARLIKKANKQNIQLDHK